MQKVSSHHHSGIIEFLELQSRAEHAQLRVVSSVGITTQEEQMVDLCTGPAGQNRTATPR